MVRDTAMSKTKISAFTVNIVGQKYKVNEIFGRSEGSKHCGEEYDMKGRPNNKFICSQLQIISQRNFPLEEQSIKSLPHSTSDSSGTTTFCCK